MIEGNNGSDFATGGAGDDLVYGGTRAAGATDTGGDSLYGDAGTDRLIGDNGALAVVTDPAATTPVTCQRGFGSGHSVTLLDLGLTPAAGTSGNDVISGGSEQDVLYGQGGMAGAATPDCQANGTFDPTARGTDDRFLDYTFGGVGGTSPASQQGALGSDVIDFNPRGAYPNNCAAGPWPTTLGSGTVDPCHWFEMTEKVNDNPAVPATLADNQHHDGIDWQYGGWDRDVLQGDRAQNGPSPGDRLIDWTGAYNLYTHCNASYGGYNDIRQRSPGMQDFLEKLAWGTGAGQTVSDAVTPGTSAFRELALVYPADNNAHGSGPAYPTTPGHFDDPVSCSD